MEKIDFLNTGGTTVKTLFVDDARDVKNYLPSKVLLSFRNILNSDNQPAREFTYEDEIVQISKSNKKKGTYYGDICLICGMGELKDQGGCATCSNCGAQLKCGL